MLGPVFYVMLTDALLLVIKLPAMAFADDLKIVASSTSYSQQDVQNAIDTIATWAVDHHMPLAVDKCAVMHCGKQQTYRQYILKGQPMAVVTSLTDLGIVRSPGFTSTEQCAAVASKAARTAYCIRRAFGFGSRKLLWPAFQAYVLPKLMYCSSSWSPCLRRDIDVIEKVQRHYTKSICGLRDMSYDDRLRELGALTLLNRRTYADMLLVYKCLHGMINCSPASLGLTLAVSNTRSDGCRLIQQRVKNKRHGSAFSCRASSTWNKLPSDIVCSKSLHMFKSRLHKHLLSSVST